MKFDRSVMSDTSAETRAMRARERSSDLNAAPMRNVYETDLRRFFVGFTWVVAGEKRYCRIDMFGDGAWLEWKTEFAFEVEISAKDRMVVCEARIRFEVHRLRSNRVH